MDILPYHWLILAGILLIIELVTFSLLFLWFALSAVIIGLLIFLLPDLAFGMQLILYSLLALLSAFLWQHLFRKKRHETAELNSRLSLYMGRETVLTKGIKQGFGQVFLDGTLWRVRAHQPLEKGQVVRVVGSDEKALALIVAPIYPSFDPSQSQHHETPSD